MKTLFKGLSISMLFALSNLQAATIEPRIIGGVPADDGEWPATVALLEESVATPGFLTLFCGATLIADRWVLTAAHCLDGKVAGEVFATIGATNWINQGTEITGKRIITHPNFNAVSFDSDIALLELDGDASQLTTTIPLYNSVPPVGSLVTIVGWGTTVFDPNTGTSSVPSADLLEAEVPIVDQAVCNNIYNGGITDNMICAGDLVNGGIDSCAGDSGGPMMQLQDGEFRQAGVVSFGNGCALPGIPGVYTRIDRFRTWISDTMAGIGSSGGGGGGGSAFSWFMLPIGLLILLLRQTRPKLFLRIRH